MGGERPMLLAIGDWLQYVGVIPSLYFVLDYGLIRTFQRVPPSPRAPRPKWWRLGQRFSLWRYRQRRFDPFYESGLGIALFCMGLAFVLAALVVFLSLWFGATYPGREVVRIFGFGFSTVSLVFMAIVYTVEKTTVTSVFAPRAVREAQERAWGQTRP